MLIYIFLLGAIAATTYLIQFKSHSNSPNEVITN